MGYAGYASGYTLGGAPTVRRSLADTVDFQPTDAKGAAVSVAVMLIGSVLFLTLLRRSGFRAMVAVGRS